MKLKDLKNDGVFEEKTIVGLKNLKYKIDSMEFNLTISDREYFHRVINQALSELSEVDVRVDEEEMINFFPQEIPKYKCRAIIEELTSSMGEWLELRGDYGKTRQLQKHKSNN